MATPNIETSIRDHVTLTVECIDRLYLNGYVPTLQTSGQLCWFLREHLGNPIPSPALLRPLHDRFVREVAAFAEAGKIPIVHFERGQRKDAVAAEHRARFIGAEGVVFIGVAQERASAFTARKLTGSERGVLFDFSRQSVAVNHSYFYLQDAEWGPAFVTVGTYLPYPVRVCLNGHEWAKQQARQAGLGFSSLDTGFGACDAPERLQALCRFADLPAGFRNRDLRPHVAALLGRDLATYSRGAMTYDLRRLRLHGLIQRVAGAHRYTLTSFGARVAFFCSKVHLRILRPGSAALVDPADTLSHPLRDALRQLDQAIDQLCAAAQLHPEVA